MVLAWELTSCSVVGWWFVSDGLALPSGGNDSRGNLLLANRAPSEARFGRVEGSVFAVGSFREDGKYHVQIRCEYVFYMDCMYLLTVLRESFISEIVLNYLPALTRNYISLHSHIRQLEKGTPHNSSKSIYLYWQARPIPTPAKLSNYPERPSFCFGRTSLERSPSHPPHPYHHPHPSGRLPTVYPSASTSNTGDRRKPGQGQIPAHPHAGSSAAPAPWTPFLKAPAPRPHTLEAAIKRIYLRLSAPSP